jgi:hypothetical protein
MAEADEISSREASCRTVLARVGLGLRKSGGGYQVVNASTHEPVAGWQGPDGGSMSLSDVEDYAFMAVRTQGRAGEMLWPVDGPPKRLPEGVALAFQKPQPSQWPETAIGPRAKNVENTPILRAGLLEKCEHLSGHENFTFWASTRPSRLLCGSCWYESQGDDPRCAFCNGPADDPTDAALAMKVTDELGVHFYLCSHCLDLDRADGASL